MKTIVVLAALAAVALSAPAVPETGFSSNQVSGADKLFVNIKREKKSPLEALSDDLTPRDKDTIPPFDREIDSASDFEPSARTFHKKPIIIKKKHGTHRLYRDSGEEDVDSQENCAKEVKVKLCDAAKHKNQDMMRSSTIENADAHMSDSDMESIKMAKDAVEDVQRCLLQDGGCKQVQGTEQKSAQLKQSDFGTDSEMHADIQDAKLALEHFQKNFGNLESMNLRATTLKNTEDLEDTKLNKEKMAQWKEAMENIQRNVEIARNIEDSFKLNPSKNIEKSVPTDLHEPAMKFNSDKLEHLEREMTASASEPIVAMIELHELPNKEKASNDDNQVKNMETTPKAEEHSINVQSNTVEKKMETELPKQGKQALSDSSRQIPEPLKHELSESQDVHNEKQVMKASENNEKLIDSKNAQLMLTPKSNLELTNIFDNDHHRAVKEWGIENQEKNVWIPTEDKDMLGKSTDNVPVKIAKSADFATESLMMSVPHVNEKLQAEFIDKSVNINQGKYADIDMSMKSADQDAHANQQDQQASTLGVSQIQPHEATKNMKAAEHINEQQQWKESSQIQPQSTNIHFDKVVPMKAAEQFNKQSHDLGLVRNSHFDQMHNNAQPTRHLQGTGLPFSHGNMMKSVEPDNDVQDTMQMNVKGAEGKSAIERNMMQWKHNEARGAYGAGAYGAAAGAGAGSGAGAVGVFPNAKVGDCGIPLLLSCSPSVVSGSLAKPHSSYGAPAAYRTGEAFKFHDKRDLKANNKVLMPKVKRTPTRVLQKIPSF